MRDWTAILQQVDHRLADRIELDQPLERIGLLREFADRDQRSVDRDRPHRDVDARAVFQPRVHHRRGFVDAPADGRDDLVDDPQQMRLVAEADRRLLEHAAPLDEDAA